MELGAAEGVGRVTVAVVGVMELGAAEGVGRVTVALGARPVVDAG
jgi:hypothetical protein